MRNACAVVILWGITCCALRSQATQIVTPDNHILTPAGTQIDLPNLRPQAVVMSPDGSRLAASGLTSELLLIDPSSKKILQRISFPGENINVPDPISDLILKPDKSGKLSYTGLIFSPDGKKIYLANVNGSVKVFLQNQQGNFVPSFTIPLPPTGNANRKIEIPAGLAITPDGKRLYVACSFSNTLVELDANDGKLLRTWDVGMLPYDLVLLDNKIYISNWAGRRPDEKSITGPAGTYVPVRIDPRTSAAAEGSVSVIDLTKNKVIKEILTGRHASGMALSPNKKYLAVANAASDTISIISTKDDEVISKFFPKSTPADLFGATPNDLVFDPKGDRLYVCNAAQNAIAVIKFHPKESTLLGLIPTAWYPGAIAFDAQRSQLCVANIKGLGSGLIKSDSAGKAFPQQSFNTHQHHGTLSLIALPPDDVELAKHTKTVLMNYRAPLLEDAMLAPREGIAAVPIPQRAGEPSLFKHVIYVIKENRTYDQVLGDMPEGDGDPSLCIFGEKVTPNQHQLCHDFVLLDHAYCSGILSADGHNWSCSAITTDYLEKSFAGFPRSYPDGSAHRSSDAMAWSPAGFIWDAALAKNRTIRIFGEFMNTTTRWRDPLRRSAPTWLEAWKDYQLKGNAIETIVEPTIASLRPHFSARYPSWGKQISDQVRATAFLEELAQWENHDDMPQLMVLALPIDHTNATTAGFPKPASQVADNDLAFGRIVEGVSHSKFWKDTCIIAIEDDPQNGWDHISAYRTTAYVVSPYSRIKKTISTNYNQTSVLRTIELILGLPPMNELDASATRMTDCFTSQPDFSPWSALPAQTKLDDMNPAKTAIIDPQQKAHAILSETLPLDVLDACPEDSLNLILWHSIKPNEPYPAWAASPEDDDDD